MTVPDDPVDTVFTNAHGETVKKFSKFEEMKYTKSIKQWIRDDKILKTTIRFYTTLFGDNTLN